MTPHNAAASRPSSKAARELQRPLRLVVADDDLDAVFLDIGMPGLSGWELARRIRERLARRPMLIGISGQYRDGADRILAQIVGFDHYVLKPYDTPALLELLEPLKLQALSAALGEKR